MADRQKEYEGLIQSFSERATKQLVGRRIVLARYMTEDERKALAWSTSVLVLVLDDGTMLFPSRDDEGNDGGALFGSDMCGESIDFPVIRPYF